MFKKTGVTWSSIRRRYIEFDSGGVAAVTVEDFLNGRNKNTEFVHGSTKVNVFDAEKLKYMLGNIMALKTVDDLEGYEVDFEDFLDIFVKEYKKVSEVRGIFFGICVDMFNIKNDNYYFDLEGLKQGSFDITQINVLKLTYPCNLEGFSGIQEKSYYFPFDCQSVWGWFFSSNQWFEEFLCGMCLNIKRGITN